MLWGVALVLVSTSCGSSGSGASNCGLVQPCGGDLTGTWKIVATCGTSSTAADSFQDSQCPNAAASADLSITGMVSFNADKSYASDEMLAGSLTISLPTSCLTQNGTTSTCADETQMFQASIDAGGTPFSTASCAGTNGGCSCTLVTTPMMNSTAGTWSTAGTTFTIVSSAGKTSTTSYCVQGSYVHVISLDMTMPMGSMGTFKITEDVVVDRD
jgi:hypothetical protein